MATTDDDLDTKIGKLPRWAQVLIRNQQEQISALESLNGTRVRAPWLYSQGSSLDWRPLAGKHDLQVRYGLDPAGPNGQFGLKLHPGKNARTLEVTSINATVLVRPLSGNHIELILDRELGMPDDPFWN